MEFLWGAIIIVLMEESGRKSNTPLQATRHQICSTASNGVFYPCGIRQMLVKARHLAHCPRE
ncbi:hypothetical protein D3Z45_05485 [Lachnospiraceae bacterium]|nr:hypothetical protein [Lachnospiraceae bacterium]